MRKIVSDIVSLKIVKDFLRREKICENQRISVRDWISFSKRGVNPSLLERGKENLQAPVQSGSGARETGLLRQFIRARAVRSVISIWRGINSFRKRGYALPSSFFRVLGCELDSLIPSELRHSLTDQYYLILDF